MNLRVAIDGPSGSGKSTLAKLLAKKLGLIYVDTGAMYRTVGLFAKRKGIMLDNVSPVTELLGDLSVEIKYVGGEQRVLLNGEDVSDYIRTNEISMYASAVSAIPQVRQFLLETQKKLAKDSSVIMDGRDIGTVIIPDAEVKLFVEASAKTRAHRRYLELLEKGEKCSEEEVLQDIIKRDENDKSRDIAPCIPAEDAIYLDNSDLTLEETVEAALKIIDERKNKAV